MSKHTSLLKYSTLILIFLQTCNARKIKPDICYPDTPSACGHIDIRYPFHLNTDPEICGDDPKFEFSCEDNQTVMSILSKKLYVQAINYNNQTIHLVDPALQTQDDLCSFSPQLLFFDQSDTIFRSYYSELRSAEPIFMFNCPSAVNSSSTFLEISGCKLSRYTYLKIGETKVSEVSDGCRMEFIAMTSLPDIKNAENNISDSDFRRALLYGFELFVVRSPRDFEETKSTLQKIYDGILQIISDGVDSSFFLYRLLIRPRYLCLWVHSWIIGKQWIYSLTTISFLHVFVVVLDWIRSESSIPLLERVAKYYFGAKFVIGLPLVTVFLVYKFKRRHLSMYDEIEGFLRTQNNFMPIRYDYSHVKRMTRGFKEKLGEGGYGTVYKGKLRSGRDVAVGIARNSKGDSIGNFLYIHFFQIQVYIQLCGNQKNILFLTDYTGVLLLFAIQ